MGTLVKSEGVVYVMEIDEDHQALPAKPNDSSNDSMNVVESDQSTASHLITHRIHVLKTRALEAYTRKPISYWILLVLATGATLVAFPTSTILARVYYVNGGKSKWILTWFANLGWPLTAVALSTTYRFSKRYPTLLNFKLVVSYMLLGFLIAADYLMYAYAFAYLPPSMFALIGSSSLVFSALFGYLIVNNKLNASILNAMVIITAAAIITALDSSSHRYPHVSQTQYITGIICAVLGSAVSGLIFALSELVFLKLLGKTSSCFILELQVMASFFAFVFSTIGVIVDGGYQQMALEARTFKGGGPSTYYMVLVWFAVACQLDILGGTAVLFLASTMLAGLLDSVKVPIISIAAVMLLSEPMSGFKILAVTITSWGCCCYIYGSSSKGELASL
ncbi:hypothetical protein Dimus_028829 [Dionaea muscipula]